MTFRSGDGTPEGGSETWGTPAGYPVEPPTTPPEAEDALRLPQGFRERFHRPGRRTLVVTTVVALLLAAVFWLRPDGADGAADTAAAAPGPSATGSTETTVPSSTAPPTTTTTAPPAPTPMPPTPELLAAVEEAKHFVALTRGLTFRHEVPVEAYDDEGFDRLLAARFHLSAEELEAEARRLAAMGVLAGEEEVDAYAHERFERLRQLAGLYLPDSGSVALRATDVSASTTRILVHELTHALDDQWFDTARDRSDHRSDSEGPTTIDMVLEGNAERVEMAWLAAQDPERRRAAGGMRQRERGDLAALLHPLDYQWFGRYVLGSPFVRHATSLGGEPAVDALLEEPPETSEQVFFTDVFDRREPRIAVPPPDPPHGQRVVEEGPAGVWFWYGVFAYAAELGPEAAERAVRGWGGDWSITWGDGEVRCETVDVVGDTPADTAELRDGVEAWADATGTVAVDEVDGRVRAEYCYPTPPPRTGDPRS